MINRVIDHIKDVYGFELVSPSIPRNRFQYFKRFVYLFILNNISERLFYFLRDKVSPIKFVLERPDREIWMRKRLGIKSCLFEIEIRPIPIEATTYMCDVKGIFCPPKLMSNIELDGVGNFRARIYYPSLSEYSYPGPEIVTFPINFETGDKSIDAYFSDIPELKSMLRDHKLKKLIDEK